MLSKKGHSDNKTSPWKLNTEEKRRMRNSIIKYSKKKKKSWEREEKISENLEYQSKWLSN